jgi:hypothetical protein
LMFLQKSRGECVFEFWNKKGEHCSWVCRLSRGAMWGPVGRRKFTYHEPSDNLLTDGFLSEDPKIIRGVRIFERQS